MSCARSSSLLLRHSNALAQLVGGHAQARIGLAQLRIQLGILLVGLRQGRSPAG